MHRSIEQKEGPPLFYIILYKINWNTTIQNKVPPTIETDLIFLMWLIMKITKIKNKYKDQ